MPEPAVVVDNVGKQYKIGLREARSQSFAEAVVRWITAPVRRLKTLREKSTGKDLFWALRDVSFTVQPGDVVGIIGRNGAGKSTLLKILSRVTEPTTGSARLHGRVGSLLEVGTGFHRELTGRENIYLNGAILGMKKAEIDRKFDEIVAFAEVEKFLDTPVKRYSSGMQVRLGFAVAAHLDPEIMIVDEVLAVGDVAFQKKCIGKMSDVAEGGRTVLFVSHNMGAVRSLCQRGILLDEGRIVCQGEVNEVVDRYLGSAGTVGNIEAVKQQLLSLRDEAVRFLDIRLHDANGVTLRKIASEDDAYLTIEYELPEALLGLRIGYDLYASDGTLLFRTYDDERLDEPSLRPAGRHASVCRLPAELFRNGVYRLSLKAGIHSVRWVLEEGVDLELEVERTQRVNANYNDPRPGVLVSPARWDLTGGTPC